MRSSQEERLTEAAVGPPPTAPLLLLVVVALLLIESAVAAALASSARGVALPAHRIWLGEVGLVGELRGVGQPLARLREAERHGFQEAVVPASAPQEGVALRMRHARTLAEALG